MGLRFECSSLVAFGCLLDGVCSLMRVLCRCFPCLTWFLNCQAVGELFGFDLIDVMLGWILVVRLLDG